MIKDVFWTVVLFSFAFSIVAIPVAYNIYTRPSEKDLFCEAVGASPGDECDAAWDAHETR